MVLFVKNIPLIAAFRDGSFLGSDPLPDGGIDLFFLVLKIVEDLYNLLPDHISFLKDFHLVERVNGRHYLVRKLQDFFPRHRHIVI